MKKIIFLFSIFLCFVSCSETEELIQTEKKGKVSFRLRTVNYVGQTPLFAPTRAEGENTIEREPKYLLVLDVMDGKVVESNVVERDTGNVLAPLELDLDFGNHTLYFVASYNLYDSYDKENQTVEWGNSNKLNFVWAKKVEKEVSQEDIEVENVDLSLMIAQLNLLIKDKLPDNLESITTSGDDLCWKLDLQTMAGVPNEVSHVTSIPESYRGKTNQFISTYTFVPENETVGDVTFVAESNDDSPQVLAQHTLTGVPVKLGYKTLYSGWFFANLGGFSFTCQDEWLGTIEKEY